MYLRAPFKYATAFTGNYACSVSFGSDWWASIMGPYLHEDEFGGVQSDSFTNTMPTSNYDVWMKR